MITCAKCHRPQGLAFGTGYAMPAADGGLGSAGDGNDWFCSEACHPLAPFPTQEELEKELKALDPRERLVHLLYARNPEALLLGYEAEEVEAYKAALVAITDDPHGMKGVEDHWPREPGVWIAVYSATKCLEVLVRLAGHPDPEQAPEEAWEAAQEWFEFNTSGGYNGPGTPCFLYDPDPDDEDEDREPDELDTNGDGVDDDDDDDDEDDDEDDEFGCARCGGECRCSGVGER